jgi:hypothetical protein
VTYRIRVDLDGTSPPLWRRIEVSSVLHLDDVHDVVQAVFGWTDSHLHRFASEPEHSDRTEYYLCPFDMAEGDEGVGEEQVRLDEVLVDVGDRLYYQYDYGDDWQHTLQLEAVLPREADAPPAVCTDGRREGPAEDCGGVHGYELIAGASDPAHPSHAELAAEFAYFYGDDVDPADFDRSPFDPGAVNRALAGLDLDGRPMVLNAPAPLAELLRVIHARPQRRRLRRLIADAGLDEPLAIDPDTAARMVHPYRWLLERVGTDGITLTAAGYLPPVHVQAAVHELGLLDEWIGTGNRENQTLPVLDLRESAQQFGLLRKQRGRLGTTARGRAVSPDPVALWRHLAERMPLGSRDVCERQAGLVLLAAVAAGTADGVDALITQLLDALGWRHDDGTPLTESTVARILGGNRAVLRRIGALTSGRGWPGSPTPEGVAFARAALRTWPAGT